MFFYVCYVYYELIRRTCVTFMYHLSRKDILIWFAISDLAEKFTFIETFDR